MIELDDTEQAVIRVGSWRFYPELNRLRDANSVIQLEPKAASVLMCLVEHAGKLVTRQDLLNAAWPDVVVSDDALTQVIIKLRKALGDSPREPRYIQTIPKRGYCLLAEVQTDTGPSATSAEQTEARLGRNSRSPVTIAALLAVVLIAGVLGYLFVGDSPPVEPGTKVVIEAPAGEGATLTVIPFMAITEKERERRFARGMYADLVTDLGGLSGLTLISPSLSSSVPVTARYQVHGDVQQAGERISVHVRLIETATRRQLWSQLYERKLTDLFEVQRSISHGVAQQLALEISTADLRRLADRYTPSLVAYEDFLHGQAELLLREREANTAARRWYRLAIERDPNFGRAYAGLALSYAAEYRNDWTLDGEAALRKAGEMAHTGAQIDPNIAEVYWVLGYVAAQDRQHETALSHLQQALNIDHSYADAYALMGGINTYRGRPELSIDQLRDALRLNPSAGFLYYLLLGRAYYFTGAYEQAMINLHESLARNPTNLETHIYLFATAAAQGDDETADWEIEEIRTIEPGFRADAWLETYPMTDSNQIEKLAGVLNRLEM
jgi:DNA-binding winged helix-turn-helix (wHTH) protein/TolB-like protein/Tfp pilus assembly protein PilF